MRKIALLALALSCVSGTTRIFADHASSWPRSKRSHSRRYNPYADSSEHRRRRSEPRYSPWG